MHLKKKNPPKQTTLVKLSFSSPGSLLSTWAHLQGFQLIGVQVHVGVKYGPVLSMPHQGRQSPGVKVRTQMIASPHLRLSPSSSLFFWGRKLATRCRGKTSPKHANTSSRLQSKVMQCFKHRLLGQIGYKKLKVKFQKISMVARKDASEVFLPTPTLQTAMEGA